MAHYKDSLFRSIVDADTIRDICNILNDTHYGAETPVIDTTLDETLFTATKNDVSGLVGGHLLVIIEHQSTLNENMPLRCLEYAARLLMDDRILDKSMIYRQKLIELPRPEFIVLYNGVDACPARKELRLSDAFRKSKGVKKRLELMVDVYNINAGQAEPPPVLSNPVIGEYSEFVGLTRRFAEEERRADAVAPRQRR
jgi:hypothetical protein